MSLGLVGVKRLRNSYRYLLQVKYQDGTCLEYVLMAQGLKHSVVDPLVPKVWMICLNSRWKPLGKHLDENLPPSNVMIWSVKLQRL